MFELWDRASGNQVGEYPSEAKASSAVRKLQKHVGNGAAEDLALGTTDDQGHPHVIATGRALLLYADLERPLPALAAVKGVLVDTHRRKEVVHGVARTCSSGAHRSGKQTASAYKRSISHHL